MRVLSILLQPYMPGVTEKILDFLKVNNEERSFNEAFIDSTKTVTLDLEQMQHIFINKVLTEEEKKAIAAKKAKK